MKLGLVEWRRIKVNKMSFGYADVKVEIKDSVNNKT